MGRACDASTPPTTTSELVCVHVFVDIFVVNWFDIQCKITVEIQNVMVCNGSAGEHNGGAC